MFSTFGIGTSINNFFQHNIKKFGFEDVQFAINNTSDFLLINTLPITEQECLIKSTMPYQMEEQIINELLNKYDLNRCKIIVYGKHTNDETVEKKYKQLEGLGFGEVYIYVGGMFEWMLLQDIYGNDEFPTTRKVNDILRFKPSRIIGRKLITYS